MLGFVFGTACLAGFIAMLHHGRHGIGCDPWMHWHGYGLHGQGPGRWLRPLFLRLETTPGQEKAIVAALEELRETGRAAHKEARAAREAVAEALRSDSPSFAGARARLQGAFEMMAQAAERALGTVHESLDQRQRRALADWIEEGHRHFGPWAGHPYRCCH